jgi:glycosyltransferase involved in cell wall biosynthesis
VAKIAIVTPWNEKCGIAAYSAKLVEELEKLRVPASILRTRVSCRNPFFFKRLGERTGGFDLVNVQYQLGLYGPKGLYTPLFFNSLSCKKVVTTIHETVAIDPTTTFGKIVSPYRKLLVKTIVANSDALIAHSKYVQEFVENFTTKKVHYVPFGTEIRKCISAENARRELGIKQKNVLLTFGFLVPNKRFEMVIEILSEIPNVFLMMVGEERNAKYSEKLRKLARILKVQDRVKFMGFVPNDKLPLIFGAADLVIFPYSYSETSAAIYSALGFGRCILASKIPAFDEFGCVEKFENKSDLIEKINYYLENPERRKDLEERRQKFSEQIRWPNIAKEIRKIYLALI